MSQQRPNCGPGDEHMKTEDEIYYDRNLLACAFAHATNAPAGWKPDPHAPDEWAIVWIETPMGQISWHVRREMAEALAPPRQDAIYTGYDRDEKNERLAQWAAEGCWS